MHQGPYDDADLCAALRDAPGPCPWYFGAPYWPAVPLARGTAWWRSPAEPERPTGGLSALWLPSGKAAALLNFHGYALPLGSGKLLVWYTHRDRTLDPEAPEWAVELILLDVDRLRPFRDLEAECAAIVRLGQFCRFAGEPEWSACIPMDHPEDPCSLSFPPAIKGHGEILLWSVITPAAEAGQQRASAYLLVLDPASGNVRRIEQRWYSSETHDTTHQWLARVARHKPTGRVVGEGVRIGCFLLTDDLSDVARQL
ncbi:MAG TPA: hypothetical protein VGM37_07520 [Armatimonadota bacterium]|jgi:hypothetical protein